MHDETKKIANELDEVMYKLQISLKYHIAYIYFLQDWKIFI